MRDEAAAHCPFLNRADARCAAHFSIDDLDYAFGHCFDRYKRCTTYVELLIERRTRHVIEPTGKTADARCHAIEVTVSDAAVVAGRARVPAVSRG